MYNLYEHQRKDKIKWVIVFCSLILLAASILGVATQGFTVIDPYSWFTKEDKPKNEPSSTTTELPEPSLEDSTLEFHNSVLMSLMADEPRAGQGITLKATITPANSETDGVTWSVAWQNPSSDFAKNNGAASNFVRLTPSGLTCAVEAIAPFGERVVITVQANVNEEAKATCTVDYVAKIVSQAIMPDTSHFFQDDTVYPDGHATVNAIVVESNSEMIKNYGERIVFDTLFDEVFTIESPVTGTVRISMTDEFFSALEFEGFDFFSTKTFDINDFTTADILNNIGVGVLVPSNRSGESFHDIAAINNFNRVVRSFGDGCALRLEVHCETEYEEADFTYYIHFDPNTTVIYPVSMTLDKNNIIL